MRVLFADHIPDRARVHLAAQGFEVSAEPSLAADSLRARLAELQPAVLVVRSTRVDAGHLASAPSLSLVVRAGAGVNTIDLEAASANGVFVANCPGKNAVAVAELTLGLLVSLDRFLPDNVADLRAGMWNKKRYSAARGLKGRTLGLIGFGDIGKAVARRVQAFGMPVVAWSRSLTPEVADAYGVHRVDSPEDVARAADAVSVHLALTPATRGLIASSILGEMKHGALFLNTSRAEVVDEQALLEALDARDLRAGLDVFSGEPSAKQGPFEHPLAQHPRVYGTHHIGASTEQAQDAVADEANRIIEVFRDTGEVANCVNLTRQTQASHRVVVRHHDQVGVLAAVLGRLVADSLNVQEMENVIFPGGAAIARIQVAGAPSGDLAQTVSDLPNVIHAAVQAL